MRFMKPIAAALALTIGAASLVGTAEARHRHRHHHNGAGMAAAGIFGLAAGALLGSALAQPRYYHYEPAPVYVAAASATGGLSARAGLLSRPDAVDAGMVRYCGQRYRSFDPQTGYFLGYDGNYHFCN